MYLKHFIGPTVAASSLFVSLLRNSHWWARASSLSRLHDHTQTHPTRQEYSRRVVSPSQRPLPDNTQLTTDRHPCFPAGFKPTILVSERPQTHALDRTATACGVLMLMYGRKHTSYKESTEAWLPAGGLLV